ncbi:MAG: DcaP family trimeric outer membrane transporter [Gammaproteobacteria bacterium]|jgi:hypothetical protein|nr:DcaP family trimeric outer membrane transporter [Gammaproteobacteria bacterium]
MTALIASPLGMAAAAENQQARHEEADSLAASSAASKAPHIAGSKGLLARPIKLKDTGISILFGGWVQADLIQDFDPVGNENQFKVNSIPVAGNPDSQLGGNTNFQIKQTRLSMDTRIDSAEGEIRTYIEGDFFGDGNSFRIRHAYGEWKGVLAGQTWSTFQDISARPLTLDYEGPDAEIFTRQAQLRYTHTVSDAVEWAIALEDPDSQVSSSQAGTGRSELPDLAANLRFTGSRGHVQVGGLARQIRFVSDAGQIDETTAGWGLNLSGSLSVREKDALMGQVAFGSGVGRYIETFSGQSADAALTSANDLEAIDAVALVAGYQRVWNAQFKSTFSLAYAEVDNIQSQPGTAIESSKSVHANLIYTPTPLLLIGGEFMWGEREDFSGDSGDATRFQFTIRYKLR